MSVWKYEKKKKKKTENNSPLLELRHIYLFQEGIMC